MEPVIATGFNYHAEEIALHGVKIHNAIDMDLPRGTKILAPADGYYIATYGEVLLREKDGAPRMLSAAKAARAAGQDINPPAAGRRHSPMLRASVSEYRKPGVAVFVKAGEVIAEVGMTGCGWGRPCYDFARFDAAARPDFHGVDYPYYTSPHLHFAVFGRRAPHSRNGRALDPFGIYGTYEEGYPIKRSYWNRKANNAKHAPLWTDQFHR